MARCRLILGLWDGLSRGCGHNRTETAVSVPADLFVMSQIPTFICSQVHAIHRDALTILSNRL